VERAPLTGRYQGLEIVTAPPPSSGGIGLLHMLGILEAADMRRAGKGRRRSCIGWPKRCGDSMRIAVSIWAIRFREDADAGRVEQGVHHASPCVHQSGQGHPSSEIAFGDPKLYESADTTHFSIVDAQGNAVAMTYTLNGGYGSGVTVPGLGMLLNNNMDNFRQPARAANAYGLVQGEANSIQPASAVSFIPKSTRLSSA